MLDIDIKSWASDVFFNLGVKLTKNTTMKLYILATLLLAAIVAADEKKSYTGYKLVRVTVPNKEQMDYITNLENTDPGV